MKMSRGNTSSKSENAMENNILQNIPDALQRDIQQIPREMFVSILQDIVDAYKRKKEDEEIDEIMEEADRERESRGTKNIPVKQARQEFIDLRNQIIEKYF